MHVRVADTGGAHAYQDVAIANGGHLDFLHA
jgi:hypothetical protein